MKKRMIFGMLMGIVFCIGAMAHADEALTDKVKDDAHSTADSVDSSAHKAKRKVVHHARKAKTDVKNSTDDNSARKAARRAKDSTNDALDKVDDTVHGH